MFTLFFFFFQAEDGIRDFHVTGVQTCALPISGPLEVREHDDDDGGSHLVLTGDYGTWIGRWEPSELPAGQRLQEPELLFEKLDPEQVVADELARMQQSAQDD